MCLSSLSIGFTITSLLWSNFLLNQFVFFISREIVDLCDQYNALAFIDECHATGFLGKTGRGTEEFVGVDGRCHIINSTLGKALGGAAGKMAY